MHRGSVSATPADAALESGAQVLSALLVERIGNPLPSAVDWDSAGQDLVALARRHKVASMLPTAPSFWRLSDQVQVALLGDRRRAVMRNMTNLSRTVAVVEALADADVPAVVLKGQGFSQFAYGDWSDRGASVDVDVLVPDHRLATAHETLVARGFDCITDGPRRPPLYGRLGRYNRWLHYERTYRSPELGTVDLHWRLMPGSASWTSFDAVVSGHGVVGAGGVTVPVPGPAHAAVIAADQAEADGWPELRCCVDVVMAWDECSEVDRIAATSMYPRMRSVVVQSRRLLATPRFVVEAQRGSRPASRLWRARVASGGASAAAARALCGRFMPARTFSRPF